MRRPREGPDSLAESCATTHNRLGQAQSTPQLAGRDQFELAGRASNGTERVIVSARRSRSRNDVLESSCWCPPRGDLKRQLVAVADAIGSFERCL